MRSQGTHNWSGKSGEEYAYRVYKLPHRFKAAPGNYIFARTSEVGGWLPIYIGHTDDLARPFHKHPLFPRILEHQATHIHVHANDGGEDARRNEEQDLVAVWKPPCNSAD